LISVARVLILTGCLLAVSPLRAEPRSLALPQLYAPLFEEGRTWDYTLRFTAHWYIDEKGEDHRARIVTHDVTWRCRVTKARRWATAAASEVHCIEASRGAKTPRAATAGKKLEPRPQSIYFERKPLEEDQQFPAITSKTGKIPIAGAYIAVAGGLYAASEMPSDEGDAKEQVSGPPLLAAQPRPALTKTKDEVAGTHVARTFRRRIERSSRRKVEAWCSEDRDGQDAPDPAYETWCFAPGDGVVTLEFSCCGAEASDGVLILDTPQSGAGSLRSK
jgi:hypothetical protein